MFSGIVEQIATVAAIQGDARQKTFSLRLATPWKDVTIGESIAINGVCLTLTAFTDETLTFTAVEETLKRSNLALLEQDAQVNVERALQMGKRISGHFVQGHIDTMGEITSMQMAGDNASLTKIKVPMDLAAYLIPKGFITVDGMSVTLIDIGDDFFTVTLIPHTRAVTIAKGYQCGDRVNIEIDMFGKYMAKFTQEKKHEGSL